MVSSLECFPPFLGEGSSAPWMEWEFGEFLKTFYEVDRKQIVLLLVSILSAGQNFDFPQYVIVFKTDQCLIKATVTYRGVAGQLLYDIV